MDSYNFHGNSNDFHGESYDLHGKSYEFHGKSYEFHGTNRFAQYFESDIPVRHRLIDDAMTEEGFLNSKHQGFRNYSGC